LFNLSTRGLGFVAATKTLTATATVTEKSSQSIFQWLDYMNIVWAHNLLEIIGLLI
jgi:hypothetical protein